MVRIGKRKGRKGYEVDIRLTLPGGKKYRKRVQSPASTLAESRRWGQQQVAIVLAEGGDKEKRGPVPTLAEFWPRFMDGHARANQEKPSSIDTRERLFRLHLNPALGDLPLDAIDDEQVQRLKGRLSGQKPKSVNNTLTILNKLLKVAVEWKVLRAMPCNIRLLKSSLSVVEFYEEPEFERLVEASRKLDPRTHLAVLLGGEAGLRLGEILGLEWHDVDLGRAQLKVQRGVYLHHVTLPKGGKPRVVPMTKRLSAALKEHRHLRGDRVLCDEDGAPVDKWWLKWAVDVAERRAGLRKGGRVHILRHTFCSRLAARNAPMLTIQKLAGHESLETTQRYMHLSSAAPKEGIALLEPGSGGGAEATGVG